MRQPSPRAHGQRERRRPKSNELSQPVSAVSGGSGGGRTSTSSAGDVPHERLSYDGTDLDGGAFGELLSANNRVSVAGVPYQKLGVLGKGGSSKVYRVLSTGGEVLESCVSRQEQRQLMAAKARTVQPSVSAAPSVGTRVVHRER